MSRTVHHTRYKHRDSTHAKDELETLIAASGGSWTYRYKIVHWDREWHSIATLRYSASVEAEGKRNGHRPRPQHRQHRLESYTYPRTHGMRRTSYTANRQERALRAADRALEWKARQVLRGAQDAVEAAWEIDFPDPRHRHFAVWDSW